MAKDSASAQGHAILEHSYLGTDPNAVTSDLGYRDRMSDPVALPSVDAPAQWVTVAALGEGAALNSVLAPDAGGVPPALLVDLDAPIRETTVDAAERAAQSSGRVLIGVASGTLDAGRRRLARALDLTLTPPQAANEAPLIASADPVTDATFLHDTAAAHSHASLMLAQVLRVIGQLDVPAALDVESLAYSTLLGGADFARWLNDQGPRSPVPPADDPVLLDRAGDRLRITLNRPQRRNAYGRQLRDALVDALRLADTDDTIKRVVLDGAGPSFCSGGDLAEFGTTPDLATAHLVRTRGGAGRLLHRLADRVEVHLHGAAVGAGIELPAFAGRVTARCDTTVRLPELSMGLIPGAGGTVSISRRIGRWRALFLALGGRSLDARIAVDWGLIDAIVWDESEG